MSDTLLTTYSILISEITVILIVVIVFLIFRLRAQKKSAQRKRKVTDTIQGNLLPYIKALIVATKDRIGQLDPVNDERQHTALVTRLRFLESQRDLMSTSDNSFDKEAYWDLVEKEYIEIKSSKSDGELSRHKEQVYQSRIENLENFKQLFVDAQTKLNDSFKTIEELRSLINEGKTPDVDKLKTKVDKLEEEKETLIEELNKASGKLQESLTALQMVEDNDTHEELSSVREENEFLVTQIQHLLEQEVESTNKMVSDIDALKDALSAKEAECQKLVKQLNEA